MFQDPTYYFNRELSWLKFDQRVLKEAVDTTNPLLERLRFLAITSSNLDEFFMIRVAGLRHQEENGIIKYDAAHMDATEQLKEINESSKRLVRVQYTYLHHVLQQLEKENLCFVKPSDLSDSQLDWLRQYFEQVVYPVVTPLAVDSGHPFPFLANKTMNTVVQIKRSEAALKRSEENGEVEVDEDMGNKIAILPIPSVLNRIVEVPTETEKRYFIYLEDIITYYCEAFFVGYEILKSMTFRVTRDADLEIDEEEAQDLLLEMEESLRRRRRGAAVRLEVVGEGDDELLNFILVSLQLKPVDAFKVNGPLDLCMYFGFCDIPGYDHLRYSPFEPCEPADLVGHEDESIFDIIRRQDIFVHHPFETFKTVEDFVAQAANDPKVLAIKQTLYRVSGNSPIISSLVKAADNGKQVTVLMEVKARFDEANNILMARRLEKAGCHVIYGLKGLKTHSKITMVVRREDDAIRRYVHLATGNYNGKTARLYTDCGIFTCNDQYGEDASAFFNLISGYSDPPIWNKFIVAPLNLREKIIAHIDEEIECAKRGEDAYIIAKMNSLLDQYVVAKLYEASSQGVKIDLIVRGICTLRPGIPGVSETIQVRSIVGRFLEHHRLFYFRHGGKDEVFLSSADWMPRNLNERVELMIPIEEKRHKERIINILNLYLADNQKAHIMNTDGTYRKVVSRDNKVSAQSALMKEAKQASDKPKPTVIERMEPMYKN
ncbi:MAG: RNA degradosome polyphosphate kinase [Veillonella sp.]|uniref:RNA degradosome polyphosphate kinase n=1 Tax=Veillonella sp. TaxID=1926307 RepID=UPI0025F7F4B0|nr:RNA degradosome polyphosphate kinase [Veillonella sp.]MBS4912556.1 RNA degradosome polyphosphate kinase [Veillonella sp.]